jgi:hypothetical protein
MGSVVEELRNEIRWELRHSYSRRWTARAIVRRIAAKIVGTLWLLCLSVAVWPLILLFLIVLFSIRDDEPILIQPPRERHAFLLSLAMITG